MQQLWATFRQKLEATSNLQLKQIRLASTQNIYPKQHLLGEGSCFIGITGPIVLWLMKCKSASIKIH